MRCYRCGAWMDAGTETCPECGFFLRSPVEIRMYEVMTDIRIYDRAKNLLWTGEGNDIAYIEAPERKIIKICWGSHFEKWISIKNGEAYRFERRLGKMAKSLEDAGLMKTRTIQKRKRSITV